ncbi:MAG: toxin C-terminal domain-containing protein [Candidatus Saccharimonadales bacterium]
MNPTEQHPKSPALEESPWHPTQVELRRIQWRNELRKQPLQEAAIRLGYVRRIPPQKAPFNSHGQEIYSDGVAFITPDVDSHTGGVWKKFDAKGRRLGTYDEQMNRIGN